MLYATSTATAHWIKTPGQIKHLHLSTQGKINAYQLNINHSKGAISFIKHHPQYYTFKQWLLLLRDHKWLIKYSVNKINRLRYTLLPAHYNGWMCIHRSEGAWYSDTGNGFYNGLQMTYNWGNGIVGNPNNYTPLQIMWAAERGYRSSGYSHGWLSGQWPNTYPPCSSYF